MTMDKTRDVLAALHRARHILVHAHAQADGDPIYIKAAELPAIRAAWAAVEVAIESASVPLDSETGADGAGSIPANGWPPVPYGDAGSSRTGFDSRPLHHNAPDTVVGDYSPTMWAPEYARTELATTFEAR